MTWWLLGNVYSQIISSHLIAVTPPQSEALWKPSRAQSNMPGIKTFLHDLWHRKIQVVVDNCSDVA